MPPPSMSPPPTGPWSRLYLEQSISTVATLLQAPTQSSLSRRPASAATPPSVVCDDTVSAACVQVAVTHCARSIATTAKATASPLTIRSETARVAVARAAADVVAFRGAAIDWTAFDTTFTAYSPYVVAAYVISAAVVVVGVNLAVQRYPYHCNRAGDSALKPGIRGG